MVTGKAEESKGRAQKGLKPGEAFKSQNPVQVRAGVRQLTQESGMQNRLNTSSATCM